MPMIFVLWIVFISVSSSFILISDLCVQLTIGRQYRPAEIVAVDAAPADDLHAAVRLSVIQQDAVAVVIAAASPAHQFVDPPSLGRVYSPFHNLHLRLGIKITPTDF
jgi:hypothetical protein